MTNILTNTITNIVTSVDSLPFDEVQLITTIISTGTVLFTSYNLLETFRPYVHFSLHYNENNQVLLIIKNTGLRAAYRITINLVDNLITKNRDIKDKEKTTWIMSSLPPQAEVETFFDSILDENENDRQDYKIEIVYYNKTQHGKKFKEYFDINIKNYIPTLSKNPENPKLISEIKQINLNLQDITQKIEKSR